MSRLPQVFRGRVVAGEGRGRQIGFPTANVAIDEQTLAAAADGVYAATVEVGGQRYPAVVNLGRQPTFGGRQVRLEAHLIGFSGDLYGAQVKVWMRHRLRDESRFDGAQALSRQIRADIEAARAHVGLTAGEENPPSPDAGE